MRLASFRYNGTTTFGVVTADGVVDCGPLLAGEFSDLRTVLTAGAVGRLAEVSDGREPDAALADVELLPPITDPAKILCAGLNYHEHRAEANRERASYPTIFTRFAYTQVGQNQPLQRPPGNLSFDYEGELAVVIGTAGFEIAEADAMSHVAGYACYNDASVRDWQNHTGQWTPGKNFPGTGAFGPWLVTADEIDDVGELELTTRVNGEQRQFAPVSDLIFSIPELIAYCSNFAPLVPGDVFVTGTPGGVGLFHQPPAFLNPGDVVEVEVSRVGVLSNTVVQR
jgi:2-keto-4-pentenoate hydratase/2-oxohepta-3-ene-1,7-dioic acid hydratase in catechol pathway